MPLGRGSREIGKPWPCSVRGCLCWEGGSWGAGGLRGSARLGDNLSRLALVGWHWTGPEQGPVPTAKTVMPALPLPTAGAVDTVPGDNACWHRDSKALSPTPPQWHKEPSLGPQAS